MNDRDGHIMDTFRTSRFFGTSAASAFSAIRDPDRLARWWGPHGFSNRFKVFEFQPGGKWIFDMIGPDGTTYPNESVFTRIELDYGVSLRHECAPYFELTISLEAMGDGTLVRWEQAFEDADVAQAVKHIVEPANEQNLDRWQLELGLPITTGHQA